METKLVKLKSDFNDIINIRNTVKNVFDILQVRIDRLHQMYGEFIKTNKSEMFVFGLDSFHFQSKLINIEYDDMRRLFLVINNRMYCEYFKLHKLIVDYISKNVFDKKVSDLVKINNFPIYKDLEPFKDYKFETILDIHENTLNLLGMLMSTLFNKENELSIHKTKQKLGLNIDNFITSFNFNINVMREKIMLFITYIEFFHKMHSKYLKRFSNKIQLMYTHISNDIKFDDSVEMSKNKKKELIEEFVTGNMDNNLLKELKTSIGSETNSEISCEGSKCSVNSGTGQGLNVSNSLESLVFLPHTSINSPIKISNHITSSSVTKLEPDGSKLEPDGSKLEPDGSKLEPVGINSENVSPVTGKKDYKTIFKRNVNKVTNFLQLFKSKPDKTVHAKASDKEIEDMFNGIEESCDSIINEKPEAKLSIDSNNIELHIDSIDNEDTKTKLVIPIQDNEDGEKKLEYSDIVKSEEYIDTAENLTSQEKNMIEEPVTEHIINQEPIIEPFEEPVIEPIKEPIKEPITNQEPIKEPIIEEPIIEEPITNQEPIIEPVIEHIIEPIKEHIIEEPLVEPVTNQEPVKEHIIEEPMEEPIIEPIKEPIIEEPMGEPVTNEEPVKKKRNYNKKKK